MRRMKLKFLAEEALRKFEYNKQKKIDQMKLIEAETKTAVSFLLNDMLCMISTRDQTIEEETENEGKEYVEIIKPNKDEDSYLFDFVDKYEVLIHPSILLKLW